LENNSINVDANNLQVVQNASEHRFEAWVNGHVSKLDKLREGGDGSTTVEVGRGASVGVAAGALLYATRSTASKRTTIFFIFI
jgi:hypothetical protein